MAQLRVQKGTVHAPTRDQMRADADKPMQWAVRQHSGKAVHVSQLRREETGLACQCACPACESPLQAVNAGVDREHFLRPNTRGQFFRHQAGQQRDNCLLVIARLAALQLLIDHHEIDLPAPSRRATVQGISGELYQAIATGKPSRVRVQDRFWFDSQTASITLEDGRIILLRLDSQRTVSGQGNYDGIITITVDDPDVASWDKEKILAQMQLHDDRRLACWDKHWDEAQLQNAAQLDAESQAAKYLDLLPAVLGCLDGLTQAQRSESVLHQVIKGILVQAAAIASPVYREPLHRYMPDGDTWSREVVLSLGELTLSQARAEQAIAGVVADIHCNAKASREESFGLIIEVAVTHRVDPAKLQKIVAMDVACLEIDVRGFRQRGRVTLDGLTTEVLRNVENKRWLHHPLIAARRAEIHRTLDQQALVMEKAIEVKRRTLRWLDSLAQEQLLAIYKDALIQYWQWGRVGKVSDHAVELPELARRLAAMGFAGTDLQGMVEHWGVLRFLHLAKTHARSRLSSDESLCEMFTVLAKSSEFRSLITYCLMGLKVFQPISSPQDFQKLKSYRAFVVKSLEAGEIAYARSCEFDPLICALFPELSGNLEYELGTQAYARALQKIKREEQEARYEKERVARAALDKMMKAEKIQRDLITAIQDASKTGWAPKLGLASDVDQILQHQAMKRAAKRFLAYGLDVREVLTSAWNARERGITLQEWFTARKLAHADEVKTLKEVLGLAWLV